MTKSAQTRARLIASAGKGFRKDGYAGVKVDSIAREAGFTSGAFYAHLESKNGAFRAALDAGLNDVIAALPNYRTEFGEDWPFAFVEYYLGGAHRADLECGCAMTGLTPDVVRAGTDVRSEYSEKMAKIVNEMSKGLPPELSEEEKHARAWAFLSTLVGGLTLARAVGTGPAANTIAETSKSAALAALGIAAR